MTWPRWRRSGSRAKRHGRSGSRLIIVDTALKERADRGDPICYGMFGAGFMARGILNQQKHLRGIRCGVVCSRDPSKAVAALRGVGIDDLEIVTSPAALDRAVARGATAVTDDVDAVVASDSIECVLEVTGNVEYGAGVVSAAIAQRKHTVLMNAELDGTIGPLLKRKADEAGVVYTGCDGDQPAVQINLLRFVESIGLLPLVCGNIKGLHDPYRNPTTQAGFAEKWGQNPWMVTSFADGTKISFEQAIVANATGMRVARRGMMGIDHDGHVDELVGRFDVDEMRDLGGIVDYVVGSAPSPGVFIFAAARDETQARYLSLGKLGDGPLYSFYVPYHLTVLEALLSVVRAVALGDAAIAPLGAPRVDVITAAKADLKQGTVLDGIGGYTVYGLCENHPEVRGEGLLPMGLADGCVLKRDVARDEIITIEDVDPPGGRLAHALRAEQDALFPV